jgi:hypothetical protein
LEQLVHEQLNFQDPKLVQFDFLDDLGERYQKRLIINDLVHDLLDVETAEVTIEESCVL